MIIYGEYLFLENFISGLFITYFAGRAAPSRIFLWCIISGFFSFSDFLPLNAFAGFIGKSLMIIMTGFTALVGHTVKRLLLNGMIFLMVTFTDGSIAAAVLNLAG